jgi:RHS repeat-associated protein
MQSLRLGNGDGRGSLISKRFALPERVPFDTSDGNFSIANELQVMTTGRASALERNAGERASDRERNRESRTSRQRSVKRGSADEAGAVSSRAAQAAAVQESSEADAKAGTLSASTPGGTIYLYSITGVLLAEYGRINGVFQPVKDYIYVGNKLLAEYRHAEVKTYFYQQDQINSIRVVTDEAGTVVYSAAHDPYGGIQQTWVKTFDPTPKFSGKERDGESGLDYFGARYYDRAQYRFVSVDQLYLFHSATFNPQHLNNYSFCWNNPTSNYDPDGREPTNITIVRTSFTAEYVQGYVLLNGESTGIHTLELPWKNNAENTSCIKGGKYKAELVYSTDLGVDVIRLEDKNDRSGILIHGGASTEDTDGCILVGLDIGTAPGTLAGGPDARQQIIDYCNSNGWSPTAGVSGLVAWAEAYFAYCQDVLAWQREEITVEVTISPQLAGQIALSIIFFTI